MLGSDFNPFKDRLEDLQETPPENGWGNIKSALDEDRSKYRGWYVFAGILLVLIPTGWVLYTSTQKDQYIAAKSSTAVAQNDEMTQVSVAQELPAPPLSDVTKTEPNLDRLSELNARTFSRSGTQTPVMAVDSLANQPKVGPSHKANALTEGDEFSINRTTQNPSGSVPSQTFVQTGEDSREKNPNLIGIKQREQNHFLTDSTDESAVLVGHELVRRSDEIVPLTLTIPTLDTAFIHKDTNDEQEVIQSQKEASKPAKWVIWPQMAVHYTFKKINPTKDLVYFMGLENENQASYKNVGYQLGVNFRRDLGAKTIFIAGVSWHMIRDYTDYRYFNILAEDVEVASVGTYSFEVITHAGIRNNEAYNTLHYVGGKIGLLQKMRMLKRERRLLATLTVGRKAATSFQVSDEQAGRFMTNDMMTTLSLGLENSVRINSEWEMTITPFVEQSLNSVYISPSVYELTPFQIGVNVGVLIPGANE